MSINETFEEIPYEMTKDTVRERVTHRDYLAIDHMRKLNDNLHATPDTTYGRGSWGYTSESHFPTHFVPFVLHFSC